MAGILIDVRTGYVYGTTEASVTKHQRATIWSSEQAVESARLEAEGEAFDGFVNDFSGLWSGVLNAYATATPATEVRPTGWYHTE